MPGDFHFHHGYALHGTLWRFLRPSGSHGCVNLPVSVAKRVYDFAPLGTPVVIHPVTCYGVAGRARMGQRNGRRVVCLGRSVDRSFTGHSHLHLGC